VRREERNGRQKESTAGGHLRGRRAGPWRQRGDHPGRSSRAPTRLGKVQIAHELGHFFLHSLVDHYTQCTAAEEPRDDDARAIEREASDFGTELLVSEARGAPYCAVKRAGVERVDRLARAFGTSFDVSAIRFVELTMAPCAVVVAEGDTVKWALESLTFPGTIANWRPLHPQSVAARLPPRAGADHARSRTSSAR
jgi:hypothetical protein